MKIHLLSATMFLSMCVLTANAQNHSDDAYEKFRKERTWEMELFETERNAEYRKFKAQYETAFSQFKQSYIAFLKEEERVVNLMVSDDGIKLQPATIRHQPVIVANASDLKTRIKQDMTDIRNLTAAKLLPSLSNAKDSVVQIQEAAQIMTDIVREFNNETTEIESISSEENPKINLATIPQQSNTNSEVTAAALDTEFLSKLKTESESQHSSNNSDANINENNCKDIFTNTGDHCIPQGKPTQYVRISSPFGTRVHPITHRKHTHKGIDMAAPKMTPVYASADGTVTFAKYNGGYGNFVKVNHGNGYKTAYAHLHKIAVQSGATVRKGDLIGYVGTTGRSTGNHLHYEVYFKDNLIDPVTTL